MKGILFKPWKVKAIADSPLGQEWQTRELIKPQPHWVDVVSGQFWANRGAPSSDYINPRYQVGEVVYIKEAWQLLELIWDGYNGGWEADVYYGQIPKDKPTAKHAVVYKLDGEDEPPWRSPLFMPAWAARYFIRITDNQPEFLNLPLSHAHDFEAEGGEQALEILEKINGLWVWRYCFERVEKPK